MATTGAVDKIDALARENAALRGASAATLPSRLLGEALSEEMRRFVSTAIGAVDQVTRVDVNTDALLRALDEESRKHQSTAAALARVEDEVVPPLRAERDLLAQRCAQLEERVKELLASESTRTQQLTTELETARQQESALRADLERLSRVTTDTAARVHATLDGMGAALSTREQAHATDNDEQRAALVVELAFARQEAQRLQLARAAELEHARTVAAAEAEHAREANRDLHAELAQLQQRFQQFVLELHAKDLDVAALKAQLDAKRDEAVTFDLPTFQALKRRRLETDAQLGAAAASGAASTKATLVHFWYDGHERIEQLENDVDALRSEKARLEATVSELKAAQSSTRDLVAAFTAVSAEVDRLRSEALSSRADNVCLQSENAALVQHVADLLCGAMTAEEVANAARAWRLAAQEGKAASATTTAADQKEAEALLRKLQEVKHETVVATRRRDFLLEQIALREKTLQAIENSVQLLSSAAGFAATSPAVRSDDEAARDGLEAPQRRLSETDAVVEEWVAEREAALEREESATRAIASLTRSFANAQESLARLREQFALGTALASGAFGVAKACCAALASQFDVLLGAQAALRELHAKAANAEAEQQQQQQQRESCTSPEVVSEVVGSAVREALGEQLAALREMAEREARRHSVRETDFVAALLESLRAKEASFEATKGLLQQTVEQHAQQLADGIARAKAAWDAKTERELQRVLVERAASEARAGVCATVAVALGKPAKKNELRQQERAEPSALSELLASLPE